MKMKIPKKAEQELNIISIEKAAKSLEKGSLKEVADDVEDSVEEFKCPKCHYKGPEDEFEG